MKPFEFKRLLDELDFREEQVASMLEENGGEVTEEVQDGLDRLEVIREALQNPENIDEMGRYMSYLESRVELIKTEKYALEAQIKRLEARIDQNKSYLAEVLTENTKGQSYTFKPAEKTEVICDNAALREEFLPKVKQLMKDALIPDYVNVSVSISKTGLDSEPQWTWPLYVKMEKRKTVTMLKPRKSKKKE